MNSDRGLGPHGSRFTLHLTHIHRLVRHHFFVAVLSHQKILAHDAPSDSPQSADLASPYSTALRSAVILACIQYKFFSGATIYVLCKQRKQGSPFPSTTPQVRWHYILLVELRPRPMPPTYSQCLFFLFQIGLLAH